MTDPTTEPPSAEERVARHLAAKDWGTTESGWTAATGAFRAAYLADAREVIAVVSAAPVAAPPAVRAALRDRIAEALYAHDHPGWRVPLRESDVEPVYRERAAAVLGAWPESADRAAVCICQHTEPQHFEDACLVCSCGDYLPPAAAREAIARYQEAVKRKPADRAALAEDLRYVLNYRGPDHAHERPGVWDTSGKPCEHCARLATAQRNLAAYDADPAAVQPVPPADQAAEIERMRERHKASLRRADEINNQLMEEVQRYAAGEERPVLWSVYNAMHLRAANAEGALQRVQRITRRLAAHAVGFQDVLDDTDRGPWGKTVAADIAELRRMTDEERPAAEAEAPLSPDYEHPACGFHWHGRDGMDIPIRDGQPVCPRCELAAIETKLRHSERLREELRSESRRRGKIKGEYAEQIRQLEIQLDEVRRQLGAEILRAGQAETELRRVADEAQQAESAAPEEALDLADGPVRCPLCPVPVTLHTPSGARAHFAAVHPEQRMEGPGPWPLLANTAELPDEAQPTTQQ